MNQLSYLASFIRLNLKVYLPSVRMLRSGNAKYKPCSPEGSLSRLGELTREPIKTRVHLGGLEMILRSSTRSADQRVTCNTKKGVWRVLKGVEYAKKFSKGAFYNLLHIDRTLFLLYNQFHNGWRVNRASVFFTKSTHSGMEGLLTNNKFIRSTLIALVHRFLFFPYETFTSFLFHHIQ